MPEKTETVELVADGIGVNPWAPMIASRPVGPPYPVKFVVRHGDTWPAVRLTVMLDYDQLMTLDTTEPRLKQALRAVLEELS